MLARRVLSARRMSRTLVLLACIACSAPHGAGPDAPRAPDAATNDAADASASIDASPGRVLRVLDNAAIIRSDGSAIENGVVFPTVVDGTPPMPSFVADPARGNVLAFTAPTDLSGHKERIEYKLAQASDADGLHFDNARYVGFAFQLPAGPAPFLGSAIFWQAWQGYPYGPPVSLKLERGSAAPYPIVLAIRNASVGPDSTVPDIPVWNGTIDPGTWHTFVVYVEPRFAGGGELKLWLDGTRVVDWTGAIGYDPSQVAGAYDGLDLKDGIYQPAANNGHALLFQRIVVATGYAATMNALGSP